MEIQNLRLRLLHIADGDIKAAKEMESYVLGEIVGTNEKTVTGEPDAGFGEECGCLICQLRKAVEEGNAKFEKIRA